MRAQESSPVTGTRDYRSSVFRRSKRRATRKKDGGYAWSWGSRPWIVREHVHKRVLWLCVREMMNAGYFVGWNERWGGRGQDLQLVLGFSPLDRRLNRLSLQRPGALDQVDETSPG